MLVQLDPAVEAAVEIAQKDQPYYLHSHVIALDSQAIRSLLQFKGSE